MVYKFCSIRHSSIMPKFCPHHYLHFPHYLLLKRLDFSLAPRIPLLRGFEYKLGEEGEVVAMDTVRVVFLFLVPLLEEEGWGTQLQ